MTKALTHCCDEWEPQSQILSNYIMQAVIHGWGDYLKRGGVEFRYCPWCGSRRTSTQAAATQKDKQP